MLAAGNLLASVAERAPAARVVVTGSAAEYGVVDAESNPVREDYPACPHTVYGVTKLLQTELSLFYGRRFGVDVVVARVFNLLGPGCIGTAVRRQRRAADPSSDRRLAGWSHRREPRRSQGLPQTGGCGRRAHHVDALRGEAGEIYNVGSGVPVRVCVMSSRPCSRKRAFLSVRFTSSRRIPAPAATFPSCTRMSPS